MDTSKKEIRNQRIMALIAVFLLAMAFCTLGQTINKSKYTIVNDTVLVLDIVGTNVDDVKRIEAVGVDNEGNEIAFDLPVKNIDVQKKKIEVRFYTLAFFRTSADGNDPAIIQLIHKDNTEDFFAVDGKKLVDIWYKK